MPRCIPGKTRAEYTGAVIAVQKTDSQVLTVQSGYCDASLAQQIFDIAEAPIETILV